MGSLFSSAKDEAKKAVDSTRGVATSVVDSTRSAATSATDSVKNAATSATEGPREPLPGHGLRLHPHLAAGLS